jgi:hypothetical protein
MSFDLAIPRRHFLHTLGGGFGALVAGAICAPKLARADDRTLDPLRPMKPRPAPGRATAKSVIFLFLVGGPSQVDTFDYKPSLQKLDGQPVPEGLRKAVEATRHSNVFHGATDKLMASPYSFKQYGQNGLWVSELFPETARHVNDLCFIHSMQAESNNHAPASYQLHTGEVRAGKSSLGSWVTYGLGSECEDLPGYVVLFDAGPLGGAANYSNGFLPPAFQPTRLRDKGAAVLDLTPPEGFALGQRKSIDLIQSLNREHLAKHQDALPLQARIASYELAYQMQAAGLEVGDLSSETAATQAMYGLDHEDDRTKSFGRKCLLARRLAERGVRFIQLYDMPDKDGWDAHGELSKNHTPRARWTDRPVAGLLADLKQRGMLDETLVIWASEFGRTPMMQGDKGRQHNAAGFTIWMAGGGVKGAQRIGATDEIGLMAVDRPIQFRDLHATILTALGLDYEDLYFEVNGRQERLTGVAGSAKVIDEVFA